MIFPCVIILPAKSTRLSNLGTVNIVKISFLFPQIDIQFFFNGSAKKDCYSFKARNIQIFKDHHENEISILIQ